MCAGALKPFTFIEKRRIRIFICGITNNNTHIVSSRFLARVLGLPEDGGEARDVIKRFGPVVGGCVDLDYVYVFICQLWVKFPCQ